MLSGRRLFDGETISHTLADVLRAPIDFEKLPKETPRGIRDLVKRCLDRDPRKRLRDIGEARIVIETLGSEPQVADAAPALTSRLGWLPLGVAGIAIIFALVVSWGRFREKPPAEAALRLSVPLPDTLRVDHFALSPDGRTLAIAGFLGNKDGTWFRALDSLELRPVSNTGGASVPFWSPDGRSLGFFDDGKLKIMPVTGGPATALCNASPSGGAWNREGVILFGGDSGPIQRVNSAGGACMPVTRAEPGARQVLPTFLPDDKHFLYVVPSADQTKAGLYIAALDQPEGRRLLPDQSSAIFVPRRNGASHDHLLFRRENTLMAQPFDADTLQFIGDPFPVASQLAGTLNPDEVAASVAGNGMLVYLAGSPGDENQLTWLDRSGRELGKVGPPRDQRAVALSPDQKSLVLTTPRNSSRPGLWLRDLDRDVETRFTQPPFVGPAVWSPDSRRIALSGPEGLYMKNIVGGPEQLLVHSNNPIPASDWSRDGKYLMYTDIDPRTHGDIWYLPLDSLGKPAGPIPFLKSEFNESQGQFSPDGQWVAYVSNESGSYEVYVRPFRSSGGPTVVSSGGGRDPRWRADGKELYYLTNPGESRLLMAVSVQTLPTGLLQFGVPKILFELQTRTILPEGNLFSYSPSADGQRFLMRVVPNDSLRTLNVITNWEKSVGIKEP
jgi:eukaryotic-like serine/threonine-protein kinase